MKTFRFLVAVLVLVVFGGTITVSATKMAGNYIKEMEAKELTRFFNEEEAEYMAQIRSYLDAEGYINSGVNVTRVVDENMRTVTVLINHKYFEKLTKDEAEDLIEIIENMGPKDEGSRVVCKINF